MLCPEEATAGKGSEDAGAAAMVIARSSPNELAHKTRIRVAPIRLSKTRLA